MNFIFVKNKFWKFIFRIRQSFYVLFYIFVFFRFFFWWKKSLIDVFIHFISNSSAIRTIKWRRMRFFLKDNTDVEQIWKKNVRILATIRWNILYRKRRIRTTMLLTNKFSLGTMKQFGTLIKQIEQWILGLKGFYRRGYWFLLNSINFQQCDVK